MLQKRMVAAMLVALVGAGIGVGIAVLSASHRTAHRTTGHQAGQADHGKLLRFTSKTVTDHYVDNSPAGLSAGDQLAQHSVWYRGGRKAGTMAVDSMVTQRTSDATGEVIFTAVAKLDGGQVVMTGSFVIVPQNQTFQAAVTGGTGAYANAHGHAVFRQVSGDTTKVTLDLRR